MVAGREGITLKIVKRDEDGSLRPWIHENQPLAELFAY